MIESISTNKKSEFNFRLLSEGLGFDFEKNTSSTKDLKKKNIPVKFRNQTINKMNNRTFNSSREDTIVKHNLKPKTANVSFLIKVISYILDAYFILFVSLVILSIIIRSVGLNIVSSNSVILNYLLVSNFLFYSILFKNNQSFSERLLNIKYIKSKSYLPFFTFFYSAHKS